MGIIQIWLYTVTLHGALRKYLQQNRNALANVMSLELNPNRCPIGAPVLVTIVGCPFLEKACK